MKTQQQKPDFARTHSLLKLGDHTTPKRAGTGLKQAYETEELGDLQRTLSGAMIFLGMEDLGDRFSTTISCDDWWPPQLETLRRGQILDVECVVPFMKPGYVPVQGFARVHAPGSIRYFDLNMRGLPGDGNGGLVGPDGAVANPALIAWTKYRPILRCMVVSYSVDYSEWEVGAKTSWSLQLREHTIIPRA